MTDEPATDGPTADANALGARLDGVISAIRSEFEHTHRARETALAAARRAIQHSANAIRAVHRDEDARARDLIAQAAATLREAQQALAAHPAIYHAGFLHDAAKEYAEAAITLSLVRGEPLPGPDDLAVEPAAYLNGLAEAVGELRRVTLDAMRGGDAVRPRALLEIMDEIFSLLVTVDYPDAITHGLRRTTDMVRGVTEKTRGELAVAASQEELRREMADLRGRLPGGAP